MDRLAQGFADAHLQEPRMKTKRRLKLPKQHAKPNTLADLAGLLFPRSPIEVDYDHTMIGGEKVYEWHIYVEGQWFDKEKTLPELAMRVYEIIESQGSDWSTVPLRVAPDWSKWSQVSAVDLASMSVLSDELRDQNSQYYNDE
jgi:hypothetical protein